MKLQSLFDRAFRLYQQGDFVEAGRLCQQIVTAEPSNFIAHHLSGLIQFQQQRAVRALASFDKALAIRPDYSEALANRGVALRELNRLEDALESFDRALTVKPNDPLALNNRGAVLSDLGRFTEALVAYEQALTVRPGYLKALNNRGNTLRHLKRYNEALSTFEKASAMAPDSAETKYNRAVVLCELRRFSEAVVSFDGALAIEPGDALVLYHRGVALYRLGKFDEALDSFEKAIFIRPDFFAALNDRGTTLLDMRRYSEALSSFDKALTIDPNSAAALSNRGAALQGLKRLKESLACFDMALAIDPTNAIFLYNRGDALRDLKHFEEALASYDKALSINPDNAMVWNNRGGSLRSLERFDDALASYDQALKVEPNNSVALYNRGSVLRDLKRMREALESYDKALAINPNFAGALASRGNILWVTFRHYEPALRDLEKAYLIDPAWDYLRGDLLHLRMYGSYWCDFEQEVAALEANVRAGARAVAPFVYQVLSESPADLQLCSETYTADRHPPIPAILTKTYRSREKIRVGYVSGEFRGQATAFLTAGLYECHDRDRFDIVAFDNGRSDTSHTRKRLEAAFGKFIDISLLPDRAAAERIRDEEIDILVNLNGYFGEARMGVFAHRPAPIQVNYLGFPGTLGANYIDYILADRIVIPEGERTFYTEKVVYLPDTYQVNDFRRQISQSSATRCESGLPGKGFVFCNFNQSYKLTPAMFTIWMRVLKRTEGSVIWLLESNRKVAENLRREAERRGVAGERLIFAPLIGVDDHLARHQLADLFLDSLPCNAHTTASDALWAGLPLLTCPGKAFSGRVAASLLYAIRMPELVTDDLEQYEALAIKLVDDPSLLSSLRRKLEKSRLTTPLFDTDQFRRHIESAYTTMWNIYMRGENPIGFDV